MKPVTTIRNLDETIKPIANWTARQYYFPYFFNQYKFNKELARFKLSSEVIFNSKTEMPSELIITGAGKKVEFKFGSRLMIDGSHLIIWRTEEDLLTVSKISLSKLDFVNDNVLDIHLKELKLGKNEIINDLSLQNFVTFERMDGLKYELDFYESFVIVIINGNEVELVPFDWFNKTGGDYGYVWPAIAQLDIARNELKGSGMRMGDFRIKLNESGKYKGGI